MTDKHEEVVRFLENLKEWCSEKAKTKLDYAIAGVKLLGEVRGELPDIEYLCEKVHKAYCKYSLENTGEEYWTKGDYNLMKEDGKEYDRRTVRAILAEIVPEYAKKNAELLELRKRVEGLPHKIALYAWGKEIPIEITELEKFIAKAIHERINRWPGEIKEGV